MAQGPPWLFEILIKGYFTILNKIPVPLPVKNNRVNGFILIFIKSYSPGRLPDFSVASLFYI